MIRYLFSSRRTGRIDPNNNHRQPVPKIVRDVIKISDVVLEILDSRYLDETRNIELEQEIKASGKILIYLINKIDLEDINEIKKKANQMKLFPYVLFSAKSRIGIKNLRERIKIEAKRGLKEKEFKKAHVCIIGYPNTGKSSVINLLKGRKYAGSSAEAGFTKGKQKIKLSKNIILFDTPGIIPEKENSTINKEDLKKHTEIGIKDYDKVKDPDFVVARLMRENHGIFEKFYEIDAKGDAEILLEKLGRKKNFLKKGDYVDTDRAARAILKDWQKGKISKSKS